MTWNDPHATTSSPLLRLDRIHRVTMNRQRPFTPAPCHTLIHNLLQMKHFRFLSQNDTYHSMALSMFLDVHFSPQVTLNNYYLESKQFSSRIEPRAHVQRPWLPFSLPSNRMWSFGSRQKELKSWNRKTSECRWLSVQMSNVTLIHSNVPQIRQQWLRWAPERNGESSNTP